MKNSQKVKTERKTHLQYIGPAGRWGTICKPSDGTHGKKLTHWPEEVTCENCVASMLKKEPIVKFITGGRS